MKILLTGSSGFVGRATVAALPPHVEVRHVIRAGAAKPARGSCVRIDDLTSPFAWEKHLKGVEAVIHLAARVHRLNDAAADPLSEFRRVNVEVTRRLAEASAGAGVRHFIYISSVKVHGEFTRTEQFRPDSPFQPVDPYGRSKAEAEECLRELESDLGLPVTVVRPPLVYGPGVSANFLRLLRLVDRGIPLPFGSVANRRDLVYVGNLAELLVECAIRSSARGGNYLVSDGEALSTPELVRAMAKALATRPRLLKVPVSVLKTAGALTGSAPQILRLVESLEIDSSSLERELGWATPYTVEQGLNRTAAWFRQEFARSRAA